MEYKTYFIIYIDILGFKLLPKDLESKKGVESRKVRNDFKEVINEQVRIVDKKELIINSKTGTDDWILVTDAKEKLFCCINEILNHNTGYKDQERIPLEIGIGVVEFDKWVKFNDSKFIAEDTTVELLSTPILKEFRAQYKNKHGESIKDTFIVLTEEVYREFDPYEQDFCQEMRYDKEKVFFSADVTKVKNRGNLFNFLKLIGREKSRIYDKIDTLFIPPIEYDDIKEWFNQARIVFISGTTECGKTYNAVRLMWKYYCKGYTPHWIEGGERWERTESRKRLEEIQRELEPHHIFYFEDPFGKVIYESRESLERDMSNIIETVENTPDVFVIITSREEVFKEFKRRQISGKELGDYEYVLSIKTSYDQNKRNEILLGWAKAKECEWLKNDEQRTWILQAMGKKDNLPTPLSIKDFTNSTIHINAKEELEKKIKEKSMQTEQVFAEEIRNMSDDKIIFLSFPLIGDFTINFVKSSYNELIKELGLKFDEFWEFDELLHWFLNEQENDKISIVNYRIIFSHPSYNQAIDYLLVDNNGLITRINREIYSRILIKLSSTPEASRRVLWAFLRDSVFLPEEIRNEISLYYSEDDDSIEEVGRYLANNFSKLSGEVGNKVLVNFAKREGTAGVVTTVISENFDLINVESRNSLLYNLSQTPEGAKASAWVVAENFMEIPIDWGTSLLLDLSIKEGTSAAVAYALKENFVEINEKARSILLLRLSKWPETAEFVAEIIFENYNELPNENKLLLFTLSEQEDTANAVAYELSEHFDTLPEDVRNPLLIELSQHSSGAIIVSRILAKYFETLPSEIKLLLFTLSEQEDTANAVAFALAEHFDTLPEDVRNPLLIELSQHSSSAIIVSRILAKYFETLPSEIKLLLFTLLEQEDTANAVASAVTEHYDRLPSEVRSIIQKMPEHRKRSLLLPIEDQKKQYQLNLKTKFEILQTLTNKRMRNILLVTCYHDLFLLEEDGRLSDQIFEQFHNLNLRILPNIEYSFSTREAMNLIERKSYDLVITTMNLDDGDPFSFAQTVKATQNIPINLMLTSTSDLDRVTGLSNRNIMDRVFLWNGDSTVFVAIIKHLEDLLNVAHDTEVGLVRVIIVVEDSIRYYSLFLPLIYSELMKQTHRLISAGINDFYNLLQMRARPKILLAETYEEAMEYYQAYQKYVIGVISEVRFLKEENEDREAGLMFINEVKKNNLTLPTALQSSELHNKKRAKEIGSYFIHKKSRRLLKSLRDFMLKFLGFGDFFFQLPDGTIVGQARNILELYQAISVVPSESLVYHGSHNHFSDWLMNRAEIEIVQKLKPVRETVFSETGLREFLLESINAILVEKSGGVVHDWDRESHSPIIRFTRLRPGFLGGKGRGIAFLQFLLNTFLLADELSQDFDIRIPKTFVIGTDEFDRFMQENDELYDISLSDTPDLDIKNSFLKANVSKSLIDDLRIILKDLTGPLSVRSSGLLEDSQYQQFAGIFETYFLPNNQELDTRVKLLCNAIKLVYASSFLKRAKSYAESTDQSVEESKMAVVIQQVVGKEYTQSKFYPAFSIIASSKNFINDTVNIEESIARIAIGLGTIITQEKDTFVFLPHQPKHSLYRNNVDLINNSQKDYMAVDLRPKPFKVHEGPNLFLIESPIEFDFNRLILSDVADTYDSETQEIIRGFLGDGIPVITFQRQLNYKIHPIRGLIQQFLIIGEKVMGGPVRIKLAGNLRASLEKKDEIYLISIDRIPH